MSFSVKKERDEINERRKFVGDIPNQVARTGSLSSSDELAQMENVLNAVLRNTSRVRSIH